jgi:hypothetical protein
VKEIFLTASDVLYALVTPSSTMAGAGDIVFEAEKGVGE